MIVDNKLMDRLTTQAKQSPRLRQAFDLRTTPDDNSQRILNACEPGTVLPIHRHMDSTETITCLRGKCVQYLYREETSFENQNNDETFPLSSEADKLRKKRSLKLVDAITLEPGGETPAMSVEVGQWHRLESLLSGTVILECKDGAYAPLSAEEIWQ